MARITKRHRVLIDRKLELIKQGEGRSVMKRSRKTANIDRSTFFGVLDKASQPVKDETKSDSKQPQT